MAESISQTVSSSASIENKAIKTETLSACPICSSTHIKFWCRGKDRLYANRNETFVYSKCRKCNIVFQSTRPTENEVFKAYTSDYSPYHGIKTPARKTTILSKAVSRISNQLVGQATFQKSVKNIFAPLGEGDCVLDFGCGAGKFLDSMARRGCRTVGIDFSPQAIDTVRANGHSAYLADENLWDALKDIQFDFVRMNHVVEHLYNPLYIFRMVLSRMKSGGILHIAVPNPNGCTARLFKSMWYGLECPRHIILYPPENLSGLLSKAGFASVKVLHEPQSKDNIRSWGYALNELGLPKQLDVENMIYSATLQLISAIPCRIASRIGMADRFHIHAVKP